MYESSCSYQSALDLKRAPPSPSNSIIKTEDFAFAQNTSDWSSYRFHQSTFEQLKQSVEKAKAALQDRTFLGTSSAFSDLYPPRISDTPENISSTTLSNNHHNNNISINNIHSPPLANVSNGSSQNNPVNHNHSHSNGMTHQRLNSVPHGSTQPHDPSLESSKSRQQSKSLKLSEWNLSEKCLKIALPDMMFRPSLNQTFYSFGNWTEKKNL